MSESTRPEGAAADLERLVSAANDAVTDEMVSRLAESASQGLDLLDRIGRSGLDQALPAIAELVRNGDLDRLVRLARVYGSAEDALTDEMVGRLTETAAGGLDLLDRVNRSDLDKALPVLSRLAASGDLERIAQLSRIVCAAEDSLTDDMVSRLAETASEAISVVDRLNRSGVVRLIELLERLDSSGALERLADRLPALVDKLDLIERLVDSLGGAARDVRAAPPPSTGMLSLIRTLGERRSMEAMQYALALAIRVQGCAEKTQQSGEGKAAS